jgi:hypothetical protein
MTTATRELLLRDLPVASIDRIRYRFTGSTNSLLARTPEAIDQLIETYPLLQMEWREDYQCFSIESANQELGTFMVYPKEGDMAILNRIVTDEACQLLASSLDEAGKRLQAAAAEIGANIGDYNPGYVRLVTGTIAKQIADDPPYDLYQILKAAISDEEESEFDQVLDTCSDQMKVVLKRLRKGLCDGSLDSDCCDGDSSTGNVADRAMVPGSGCSECGLEQCPGGWPCEQG